MVSFPSHLSTLSLRFTPPHLGLLTHLRAILIERKINEPHFIRDFVPKILLALRFKTIFLYVCLFSPRGYKKSYIFLQYLSISVALSEFRVYLYQSFFFLYCMTYKIHFKEKKLCDYWKICEINKWLILYKWYNINDKITNLFLIYFFFPGKQELCCIS